MKNEIKDFFIRKGLEITVGNLSNKHQEYVAKKTNVDYIPEDATFVSGIANMFIYYGIAGAIYTSQVNEIDWLSVPLIANFGNLLGWLEFEALRNTQSVYGQKGVPSIPGRIVSGIIDIGVYTTKQISKKINNEPPKTI